MNPQTLLRLAVHVTAIRLPVAVGIPLPLNAFRMKSAKTQVIQAFSLLPWSPPVGGRGVYPGKRAAPARVPVVQSTILYAIKALVKLI